MFGSPETTRCYDHSVQELVYARSDRKSVRVSWFLFIAEPVTKSLCPRLACIPELEHYSRGILEISAAFAHIECHLPVSARLLCQRIDISKIWEHTFCHFPSKLHCSPVIPFEPIFIPGLSARTTAEAPIIYQICDGDVLVDPDSHEPDAPGIQNYLVLHIHNPSGYAFGELESLVLFMLFLGD